ncbi:MAG: amidohydrolase [Chloroflexota bacterium]|nr:amidohydrolase [Chloroflexota bacterium]MDE2908207.1 amidohydrolase [Chloroflexota bacterium]
MIDLLIRNAAVLRLKDERAAILTDHDIAVRGRRIDSIAPSGAIDLSQAKTVIDAGGQLAMPGFINTHAHVPMALWRGLGEDVNIDNWFNDIIWHLEANLQPEDVYWGMQLGLMEMIEAGITAVADHYWHMDYAARAVEKAGTRALLGQAMFGANGMRQIEETAAFVKRWDGQASGRIRTIMAPHAPYTCDDDFLRASANMAERIGSGIHIHAAETREQTQASLARRGKTPIEALQECGIFSVPTILAHAVGAAPGDLEILADLRTPVGIAHCPKTYAKLAMGANNLVEWRTLGLAIGLGTDGAVSSNTLDLWEAMRLTALGQKQLTGDAEKLTIPQALTIATTESARVYGGADDLGDLAAGKLADIILVDLSGAHHFPLNSVAASLVYNARASDVRTVICDGQVIMRERVHLTLDRNEIIANIKPRMERLRRRDNAGVIQTYAP